MRRFGALTDQLGALADQLGVFHIPMARAEDPPFIMPHTRSEGAAVGAAATL
jgi:hypothetical protein